MTFDPQRAARRAFRRGLAALIVVACGACATEPDDVAPFAALATPLPLRADAADAFVPGEELVYDVAFGPFTVGEATYRVAAAELDGRPALRFEGVTAPRGLFAAFAKAGGVTRVVVDGATFAPSSAFWITAERDDPLVRIAAFDAGVARTAAFQREWSMTRTHRGGAFFDPVSAMFLLRVLEPPPPGEERRLVLVEGVRPHLMTIRTVGPEPVEVADDARPRPALKLAVRGDRLSDDGTLAEAKPLNNFFVWLAETPRREPLKLAGRIAFGGVTLVLRPPVIPTPAEGSSGP